MLMTLTRVTADAHKPGCGSGAPFGGSGSIPVIWVNTSWLLGWAASWPAGGRSAEAGECGACASLPPSQGEQDVGEAVTSYPSPLSL